LIRYKRCRREFQAKDRLQFIDRPNTGAGPVAVRFVHDEHEVRQLGQILEITLADVFRKAFDAGRFSAANFRVDFRNVENVDLAAQNLVKQRARLRFVIVAGDDLRCISGEFCDIPFEDVFRGVRCEVGISLL
jgi:hypothetical protein